jgi:hypothetical protein
MSTRDMVYPAMKTQTLLRRAMRVSTFGLLALAVFAGSSCTTTYDSAGRPMQSVDPGTAAAGAVAAGVLGYAVGNNRSNDRRYYQRGGYYRTPYYGHRH